MNKYKLEYWYGSYHGFVDIWANDADEAIEKMWTDFRRRGLLTLPMAYKRAKVVDQ